MAARSIAFGLLAILLVGPRSYVLAQSEIPGAPSNAPPRVKDVTARAEGIGDKIEAIFFNVEIAENYFREEKIKNRLNGYLDQIGAKPGAGETHIFYVQALVANGRVTELKDFQYLTNGKTGEDALRESFTIDKSPGTEDRLNAVDGATKGARLVGLYVTASPEEGKFAIRGMSFTPDYYQKIQKEGLALREQRAKARAEEERIRAIRQQRAATHAANDQAARAQLQRDLARGPLPPGPAMFPPGPPSSGLPTIYLPPTTSAAQPSLAPTPSAPVAHPAVPFDPPPETKPVEPPASVPAKPGTAIPGPT